MRGGDVYPLLTATPATTRSVADRLKGRTATTLEVLAVRRALVTLLSHGDVLRKPDPNNPRNGWLWWRP